MSKTFHVCLDILGAVQWPDNELKELLTDENGDPYTVEEIRAFLQGELDEGRRFLRFADCLRFDPNVGCLGHSTSPSPASPATLDELMPHVLPEGRDPGGEA